MRHFERTAIAFIVFIVLICNAARLSLAHNPAGPAWAHVANSSDGHWAVYRSTARNQILTKFKIVSAKDGTQRRVFAVPHGPVALSPDGAMLATGDDYIKDGATTLNRIKLWDTKTGKLLKSWSGIPGYFERHSMYNNINAALAFSTDGKQLVSLVYGAQVDSYFKYGHVAAYDIAAGNKGKARMWLLSGRALDDPALPSITLSGWGSFVAVETIKGSLYLFEAQTGKLLHRVQAWTKQAHRPVRPPVVFSTDESTVETTEGDEAKVWSVKTGELLRVVQRARAQPAK